MVLSEIAAATLIAICGVKKSYRIVLKTERIVRRRIRRPAPVIEGYSSFPRSLFRAIFRAGQTIAMRWEGRAKNAAQHAREARLRGATRAREQVSHMSADMRARAHDMRGRALETAARVQDRVRAAQQSAAASAREKVSAARDRLVSARDQAAAAAAATTTASQSTDASNKDPHSLDEKTSEEADPTVERPPSRGSSSRVGLASILDEHMGVNLKKSAQDLQASTISGSANGPSEPNVAISDSLDNCPDTGDESGKAKPRSIRTRV